MLARAAPPSGFIEPCLPSPGEQPPTGPDWVHEIKHDGYRLMARRDPVSVGIRLLTRNGHDWASRYPLIVQAVNKLKARSCLIDGEAVLRWVYKTPPHSAIVGRTRVFDHSTV